MLLIPNGVGNYGIMMGKGWGMEGAKSCTLSFSQVHRASRSLRGFH